MPQYSVFDGARFIARLDYAYPELRIGIEADSWRHHSGRRAWERDFRRRDALTLLDWVVIHITWQQLEGDPDGVARRVDKARSLAAARN